MPVEANMGEGKAWGFLCLEMKIGSYYWQRTESLYLCGFVLLFAFVLVFAWESVGGPAAGWLVSEKRRENPPQVLQHQTSSPESQPTQKMVLRCCLATLVRLSQFSPQHNPLPWFHLRQAGWCAATCVCVLPGSPGRTEYSPLHNWLHSCLTLNHKRSSSTTLNILHTFSTKFSTKSAFSTFSIFSTNFTNFTNFPTHLVALVSAPPPPWQQPPLIFLHSSVGSPDLFCPTLLLKMKQHSALFYWQMEGKW